MTTPPSIQYRDNIDDDVEEGGHSLPTADQQKVTAALDNGHSADASGSWFKSLSQSKRRLLIGGVGIAVCLILIISISVSLAKGGKGGGGNSVNSSSNNDPAFLAVVEYLSGNNGALADRATLLKTGTPQNLAALWMAEDAYVNIPTTYIVEEAFPFVKRYALAVLYYSLNGPSWTNQYSFLTKQSECDRWQQSFTTGAADSSLICGVRCDTTGHVTDVFIPYNNLAGSMPTEIRLLPYLSHLSLYGNSIGGELPADMSSLTELQFLSLEENYLSGSVPSWLGYFDKLEYLNLGFNRFAGALPAELSGMTSLKEVSFEWNQITGNLHAALNGIPTLESVFMERNLLHEQLGVDFLANADALLHLDLSDNRLHGTLPPHLINLLLLDVRNNTLSGALPDFSNGGDKLQYFAANDNGFTGNMPSYLSSLTDLIHLDVSSNQLTGTIPTDIEGMTTLQYLFLGNNRLKEAAVPDYSALTQLRALSLKNTRRIGSFPEYIGSKLTQLVVLDLSENLMTGTIPANLAHLNRLGLLAVYSNQDLAGNVTDMCSYSSDYSNNFSNGTTMLLDCSALCPCCKICCANGNCTNVAQETIFNYLTIGYLRSQKVFSEDVQPQ